MLQTILIPSSSFTLNEAADWVHNHKYKILKIDATQEYYRFRQTVPNPSLKYYTKTLPNGIKLVFQENVTCKDCPRHNKPR